MSQLVSSINWAYCRSHGFSVKIQNRENTGEKEAHSGTQQTHICTHKHWIFYQDFVPGIVTHTSNSLQPLISFFFYFQGASYTLHLSKPWTTQVAASGKEPACQCTRCKRYRFDFWVGKIPWGRARQPTPVFLPGESHGQRKLVNPNLAYTYD